MTEAEGDLLAIALHYATASGNTQRNYELLREAAHRVRRERTGAQERNVILRLKTFVQEVDPASLPVQFQAVQEALHELQKRG